MIGFEVGLAGAAFTAGLLMFLAPCTLPLVPAYLAFISGVSPNSLKNEGELRRAKRQIVINGTFFVLGFSLIFISFGLLIAYIGSYLGTLRSILTPIGGFFIIIFGLFMLEIIKLPTLMKERRVKLPIVLEPGHPISAFAIGVTFALGWSPCIGPVLASVLFLASTKTTVVAGGVLLAIFSLGLAIPFLLSAALYSQSQRFITKNAKFSLAIARVGGVFLILIGVLLLSDNFGLLIDYGYRVAEYFGVERLYDFY